MGINKELLIQHKYVLPDIGYETGYNLLHRMGLTTQMPTERVFATNKARDCVREDKALGIFVKPPKTEITATNKMYLQFLDAVELMDRAPIDETDPYALLARYIEEKISDLIICWRLRINITEKTQFFKLRTLQLWEVILDEFAYG